MELDLAYKARPTDGPFHLQWSEPTPHSYGWKSFIRFTRWSNVIDADGSKGWFWSLVMFGHFQTYLGSAKCDGSRTYMYRSGMLGNPFHSHTGYVMTTQPEEMWAFRWRKSSDTIADTPHWDSMGAS